MVFFVQYAIQKSTGNVEIITISTLAETLPGSLSKKGLARGVLRYSEHSAFRMFSLSKRFQTMGRSPLGGTGDNSKRGVRAY
ncbi:hypothetical protein TNCV_2008951 [Trichonephila clavipes]|nr:hypothetical protein TNCV_2008951 [Trichonephila clavipes]